MQQFGEQAGSSELRAKGREIILFLPKEPHAHGESPGFRIQLVELSLKTAKTLSWCHADL